MENQYRFKVVFYGNHRVGKTSIVNKHLTGEFHAHVKEPTALFDTTTIELTGKKGIKYSVIMDLYHSPKEDILTDSPVFIGKADAIVAVFSFDDYKSFEDTEGWLFFGMSHSDPKVQFIIASKADKKEKVVQRSEGIDLAKRLGVNYFEVSARSGKNIQDFFETLAKILLKQKLVSTQKLSKQPSLLQQFSKSNEEYQRLDSEINSVFDH
ncbi:hypothetical protein ENUP19_0188G0005 [Entamoeba nuttalli]